MVKRAQRTRCLCFVQLLAQLDLLHQRPLFLMQVSEQPFTRIRSCRIEAVMFRSLQDETLFCQRQRHKGRLHHQPGQSLAMADDLLARFIQIAAKAGKGAQLMKLCQLQLQSG